MFLLCHLWRISLSSIQLSSPVQTRSFYVRRKSNASTGTNCVTELPIVRMELMRKMPVVSIWFHVTFFSFSLKLMMTWLCVCMCLQVSLFISFPVLYLMHCLVYHFIVKLLLIPKRKDFNEVKRGEEDDDSFSMWKAWHKRSNKENTWIPPSSFLSISFTQWPPTLKIRKCVFAYLFHFLSFTYLLVWVNFSVWRLTVWFFTW